MCKNMYVDTPFHRKLLKNILRQEKQKHGTQQIMVLGPGVMKENPGKNH
jgi:hypothetical protein